MITVIITITNLSFNPSIHQLFRDSLSFHPLCKQVWPLVNRKVLFVHAKTMSAIPENMHFSRYFVFFQSHVKFD